MNARHAAADGSFARSAGGAAGRGIAVVLVAVLLGIVLLRSALDGPGDGVIDAGAGPGVTTPTTDAGGGSTPGTTTDPTGTTVPTDTTTPPAETIPPNTIKVTVANGAGVQGAAGAVTDTLNTLAYVTGEPTNAATSDYTTTAVFFVDGSDQAAAQVAAALSLAAAPQPMPEATPLRDVADLDGAVVLVVVGTDLAGA